ncbi:MAG TPA: hypothetical protein VMG12_41145 [Polyangiaceae bacterium]|nr:hypothetical protein [Polyangiaceae bacterium]
MCLSCAQVLGIPSDPELTSRESQRSPTPEPANDPMLSQPDMAAPGSLGDAEPSDGRGARADGVLPPGDIAGIDETQESDGTTPDAETPDPDGTSPADAGVADAGSEPLPPGCEGRFERVPVDVVFIVDNSGSMPEEAETFEQTLPSFVALLEEDEVDYRIILISRHRRDARSASDEASTSVCIAAPISGLASCPSDRPALGARFFQYSVKIDDDDSFERTLQASSTPDPFELTATGWLEWLRTGARTVFVEITDSDSALPASEFVSGLQAVAPDVFGSDPARPGFVFHSIVGLAQKSLAADIYFADEPIQPELCAGTGSNPDNAGLVYQELSRATGGLRLSICPAAALGLRLAALASDVTLRSVRECSGAD